MMGLAVEPTPGMKCIQHILLAFNTIFAFTGVILVTCTVFSIYNESKYAEFIEDRFFTHSMFVILVGCFIFVISMFGFYGAFKLSVAVIMMYCILLSIVFILEITACMIGYLLQDQIEEMLVSSLNQTMYDYDKDPVAAFIVDSLQNNFFCCGIESPRDWAGILSSNNSVHEILLPTSCCVYYGNGVCMDFKPSGCLPHLKYSLARSSVLLCSWIFMVALLQLLGVIFVYKLAHQLRKQKSLRDRLKWEVKEKVVPDYCDLPKFMQEVNYPNLNIEDTSKKNPVDCNEYKK